MSNSAAESVADAESSKMGSCGLPENFPVGMKVLLVDDDLTCLAVVKRMLLSCQYAVKTCSRATEALSLLREDNNAFDLIVSDVHMPDMDGFRLLELVGLEMDLPVIMMSADTRFNIVMKGIKHGACDFLFKPVRLSELQNIWQHVVRRKWHENKGTEHSASMEETDCNRPITDDSGFPSSANDGSDGSSRSQKKKRDSKEEDDGELDAPDPSSSKKARVVWSVELHQQFVNAVNQLGIDKAVPKRILDLMNVPGLTRENVASHLQKFRLYLKRMSGVAQQNNFYGVPSNGRITQLPNHNLNALTVAGQIPSQTLAALQDELLGRPSRSLATIPALNQPILGQATVQGIKSERGIAFGGQNTSTSFQVWPSNHLSNVGSTSSIGGLNTSQNHIMLGLTSPQQQPHSFLSESPTVNVQPSRLVAPSRSSEKYQVQTGTVLLNQDSHLVPSQSSPSFQAARSFITVNQNAGAPLSSNSLQTGNKPVVLNEGSVILPSQSVTGISPRNNPGILNQSSAVISSTPLASFQVTSNRHLANQNSARAPSQLSATFSVESHAAQSTSISNLNNNNSVVDYSHLSSQLHNINQQTSMGQLFDGGFNSAAQVNSHSAPGSAPVPSCTGGWRVHGPDGNIAHPDGSSSSSCNIQATGRLNGPSVKLYDQEQARNLGFVGSGAILPSRFVADDIEYPTSNFSHIASTGDESFLLNQDPFGLNGTIQGGRCATSFK